MEYLPELAIAAALAWASGLRLYAVLLAVGLLGRYGAVPIPESLQILTHPAVITASGFMVFVEFFADKIPGVDSLWDAVHTFIRIPAGAALAAAVLGADSEVMTIAAAILGGTIAAGTHFGKAGTRALINTSPEPVSNVAASFSEEAMLAGGMWMAWFHPLVFLVLLALFLILAVWLIAKLWQLIRNLLDGMKTENKRTKLLPDLRTENGGLRTE
ncbi:MAG: DUF4126 domain-containing protein [Burkholderiales bacterium]